MGAVIGIARNREREILNVARHIVFMAERGRLKGLAVCAKLIDDKEEINIAGVYRTSPARGVNVAMRMSWRLTQLQDDME